jgi:hypothetical protein
MLDETLLDEVQKLFLDLRYNSTHEIEKLFDIYVTDFELKDAKVFLVILNDPIYLFEGLPFAKILLSKAFMNLERHQQVTTLGTAIRQAWTLLALKESE